VNPGTAAMAAFLACLPMHAIAQDSACGGPRELTLCEAELYEAGVIWEGRANETRAKLTGCLDRLRVRTSTVIRALAVPPPPDLQPTWKHDAVMMSLAGISGLGLGVVLGVLLGR